MSKSHPKVIILIKHGLYLPYIELAQNGQGSTFLNDPRKSEIRVIHFYGIPGGKTVQFLDRTHEYFRWKNRFTKILLRMLDWVISAPFMLWIPKVEKSMELHLSDEEVQCSVIDTIQTLRWKQLAVYRHILSNYEFDYVYETNASSFIDFTNLLAQVVKFDTSPLYAGNLPTKKFVSGANRFFDRRALEILIRNRHRWSPALLEDVAIGRVMQRSSVSPIVTSSISIASLEELQVLPDAMIVNHYHFRVKSYLAGQRSDAMIMQAIRSRFLKIRANTSL
jgi:hypothetical protein